ncbi:uncharacterized protein [Bemisia tabaci]|uniref:uncharacterized protein isoform X2 n=1 Tax=Bemisia tabaci TaxID=7038 RepID=UPI003B28A7EA
MSRASLNKNVVARPPRIRKVSRTESECSERGEEAARLTGGEGDECSPSAEEDNMSYCEYHDIPPPPDGGYGWVIVFASFLSNMIVDGIAYTFGIFLQEFVKHFGESQGKTAWVGSLLSGMYLSAGPVVSALTNKFGCRKVCITGSIVSCLAFVLSIFSANVNQLMLSYGVLGGIGFGLIYLPAVVCVGYYFETKRSLATGIAVCGSGVGTFAFAPFAAFLIEQYGWKGANLILAGLILNCAVFGALMRPLEYPKGSGTKPLLQRMADERRFQMERGSIGGSYFIVQLPDGSMEKRLKMPINVDPGVHSSFNLDQLVAGSPITPVPTMPVLPTISEVKAPEQSGSSNNSSSGSANELKLDLKKSASTKKIEGVEEEEEKQGEKQNNIDNKDSKESKDAKSSKENVKVKSNENVNEKIELNERTQNGTEPTNKGLMPRNASQPSFTSHAQGLPKNGSVPFFDRIRKTSAGDRYRPPVAAMKVPRPNVSSNTDMRKSLHLRLSASSNLGGSKNNNCDEMWSKTDIDSESVCFAVSKQSLHARKEMVRPLSRKDIFYSGSVINLPEYQTQKSLTSYRQSVVSLPRYGTQRAMDGGDVEKGPPDLCPCFALPDSFKSVLSSMLDLSLIKDPVFMFIGLSNVFGMAGLYVPFVYLVDAAKQQGIEDSKASFLISIIGIINTVGRVGCGFIADFPWVDSLLLNNICLIICTLSVAAVPICSTYVHYIIMCVFFGLAVSGYISLTSIILVDLLGLDRLTNAFGLLILFRGAAAIVGSPLAGAVLDATHSYDLPFYMAALFFLISAMFSFLAPAMKRCVTVEEPAPIGDALTPIDEDEEEEEDDDEDQDDEPPTMGVIPEIVETKPSPVNPPERKSPLHEIESCL